MKRLGLLALAGFMGTAIAATTTTTTVVPTTAQTTTTTTAATSAPAQFSASQQAAIQQMVHDYLVSHPEVLIEAGQALQMKQQEMMQEKAQKLIPALATTLLNDPSSPTAGNPKGSVAVVEFFDYQCPHCKAMGPEITTLLAHNPDVKVIYKELPIFGADSEFAAKAALAAQRQGKFEAMHNALLNAPGRLTNQQVLDLAKSVGINVNQLQADMNLPEYKHELEAVASLANQLGISGTPAFIVIANKNGKINSQFIPGQTNAADLTKSIAAVK